MRQPFPENLRATAAALLLFGATLTGWTASPELKTIGLLLPPDEPMASNILSGASLAIAKLNASGGHRWQLLSRGRRGQWGDDGVEAGRMVLDDDILGLIAPPSGAATHLALQVAGRTRIPVVTLCADSSVTGAGIPWMLQIIPETQLQAATLLSDSTGQAHRWTPLVPLGRAGREIDHDLQRAASMTGAKLSSSIPVPSPLLDPCTIVKPLVSLWPEAILLWLDPDSAGRIARVLRSAGFTGPIRGPATLRSPAFTAAAGQAAESCQIPLLRSALGEAEALGEDLLGALAHDAVLCLAASEDRPSEKTKSRVHTVRSAIEPLTGPLEFDQEGRRRVELEITPRRKGLSTP